MTLGAAPRMIVVNPNNSNEMIVTGLDNTCYFSPAFYATADRGSSWSHSCILFNDGMGDEVVGYDLNNIVYGGGIAEGTVLYLAASPDNGATWGKLKVVDSHFRGLLWPRMAVDTSPSSPFANRLYISAVHGGLNSANTRVHLAFSGDGGQHWAGKNLDSWQFPNTDAFPYLSVGIDGELYMTWMYCKTQYDYGPCQRGGNPILLSKSSDGGSSWSKPTVIAKTNQPPDNCLYGCLPNTMAGLTFFPVSAVTGAGPTARISVTFCTWTGTQLQIGVVTSNDGGATFGPPIRVSNSRFGDQFLPWISASQDGTLTVSWFDRRNDPANLKYEPYFATSLDGFSFTASKPFSSAMSDPSAYGGGFFWPGTDAWAGKTIYAAWIDNSTGVVHIDLGGATF